MNQIEERQEDNIWKMRNKLGSEYQAFSGIDLRAQTDYPGVVYPLTIGHEVPSFSSITAHINEKSKIVHSEYRLFIGTEKEKTYIKGRCATLVRGYTPKKLPRVVQPEPVTQKLIDKIFNITPIQPKKVIQTEATPMPSYILRNELDSEDGKEFLHGLAEAWDQTAFEPDTDFIKKENIIHEVAKIKTQNNLWKHNSYFNYNDKYDEYDEYNEYETEYDKKQTTKQTKGESKVSELSLYQKKLYITEQGYATWTEIYEKTVQQVNSFYEEIIELEASAIEEEAEEKKTNIKKETRGHSISYGENTYNQDQIAKIRFLLEEEDYLSFAKINQMTDYNIIAYYENFYQESFKGA